MDRNEDSERADALAEEICDCIIHQIQRRMREEAEPTDERRAAVLNTLRLGNSQHKERAQAAWDELEPSLRMSTLRRAAEQTPELQVVFTKLQEQLSDTKFSTHMVKQIVLGLVGLAEFVWKEDKK